MHISYCAMCACHALSPHQNDGDDDMTTQPITLQQARQNAQADEAFQAFVSRPRTWLTVLAERHRAEASSRSTKS